MACNKIQWLKQAKLKKRSEQFTKNMSDKTNISENGIFDVVFS